MNACVYMMCMYVTYACTLYTDIWKANKWFFNPEDFCMCLFFISTTFITDIFTKPLFNI